MSSIEEIAAEESPAAVGPYSQGVTFENHVFVSGQLPLKPEGGMVSGDIADQAEQCLENIEKILSEAGANFDDVLKARIFLDDLDDFDEVNEVYRKFFSEPYPARSCVEVARLPKGAGLEIEVLARR
ncbi:Rid family detoxifying hydrolase [Halarsenatibacter silvermanii]|uniref:Endoribonuclease L-PSP n=1 Tax=Halarsenatibacter silvermanii TaxID=321763 RepID=A0A1G9RHS7_9FIRM|nr:Rid family detoxifying hydrolase [Halarsenatibacter silvermanii]SDM22796.1 endoribonuclease L-PSP [Halarsenatibacter silvermanii]